MHLGPLASQPISALCASFPNKRATPSERGASFFSCPEYSIISPVVSRSCPDWVHRVSQSPSRARLNLRISAATWAVFPASYIVRTFHVPMFKLFLVERRVVGIVASFRLWPQHFMRPGKPGPTSSCLLLYGNYFVSKTPQYNYCYHALLYNTIHK